MYYIKYYLPGTSLYINIYALIKNKFLNRINKTKLPTNFVLYNIYINQLINILFKTIQWINHANVIS